MSNYVISENQITTHSRKKKLGWSRKHRRPGGEYLDPTLSLEELLTYSEQSKKRTKSRGDVGSSRKRDALTRDKSKYELRYE